MVSEAIVVVLIILVIANVGLSVYNTTHPPCDDLDEYFTATKKLPDGMLIGLGSIPSGTDVHYVGAKTVSTGKPGVIGLRSRNKDLEKPVVPHDSSSLQKAVNRMFDNMVAKQEDERTTKSRTDYDKGNSAMFEVEMEGLKAGNDHRNTDYRTTKPSGFMYEYNTDGYSERKPNDW